MNTTAEATAPPPAVAPCNTLEQLKQAALKRREREATWRTQEAEANESHRRNEWEKLIGQVVQDHPYFAGLVTGRFDSQETSWTGRGHVITDNGAALEVATPGAVPVEFSYQRFVDHEGRPGPWKQAAIGAAMDQSPDDAKLYEVARGWHVDPDNEPEGVTPRWQQRLRTDDLGEALLAAEESYREKCLRVKEAVRQRDTHFAESRRPRKARLTAEERALLALKDLFLEVRDMIAEDEDAAEEAMGGDE